METRARIPLAHGDELLIEVETYMIGGRPPREATVTLKRLGPVTPGVSVELRARFEVRPEDSDQKVRRRAVEAIRQHVERLAPQLKAALDKERGLFGGL